MNTYRLNTILIKERAMDWMRRITQHLQENIIGPPEKALVQEKKMLRDLNFETCSAAELQAFFKDKAFQKDAQHMLSIYLELGISLVEKKRDQINDEMHFDKHHSQRNTAFHRTCLQDLDVKVHMLRSVKHMLQYDPWSFGMPRSSGLRVTLVNLAASATFRGFIFFLILINCALLAVDSPPRVGAERVALDVVQIPIYGSFIFEMLVLVVGGGPATYWQDSWNRMDFFIVVGSIVDMTTYYTVLSGDEEGGGESVSIFLLLSGLRTLRALRPLRMLRRAKTLRRLGLTIVKSLSALTSSMVLFVAFIYVVAVLMLQFLAGRLSQCSDQNVHFQTECTGVDAFDKPRRWVPSISNSDWLGPALLSALAVASGNGWGSTMSRALNAGQEGEGPVFRAAPAVSALYILVVLAGRFLFANLFLAVIAESYARVSLERRHRVKMKRGHLRRLKNLAHVHHKTAELLQAEGLKTAAETNRKMSVYLRSHPPAQTGAEVVFLNIDWF